MKRIHLTASVDSDCAPEFFNLLANSPDVRETRVLDWNMAARDTTTLLYAIEGAVEPFCASATDTPGIESVEVSALDQNPSYVTVEARPQAVPMFDSISQALARSGLIVRKPIIYRDSEMIGRIVGDPASLEAALESTPDSIRTQIDEIGTYRGESKRLGTALSDRQQEALETAVKLGYYDMPRGATHAEVADELGCAPATVTEHLQKAEKKVVQVATDEFEQSI